MAASHTKSDLFQLVKSMTPSEKRHFRLDNPSKKGKEKSEENQFLLLFDILEKQKKEDEEDAKLIINKLLFKNSFNPVMSKSHRHVIANIIT